MDLLEAVAFAQRAADKTGYPMVIFEHLDGRDHSIMRYIKGDEQGNFGEHFVAKIEPQSLEQEAQ